MASKRTPSRTVNFSALATPIAKRHFCAWPVLQKSHGLPRERCGDSREIPKENDVDDHIGYDLQGLFGIKQTAYKAYYTPAPQTMAQRQEYCITEQATTKEAKGLYLVVEVDNIFYQRLYTAGRYKVLPNLNRREYETIINILN